MAPSGPRAIAPSPQMAEDCPVAPAASAIVMANQMRLTSQAPRQMPPIALSHKVDEQIAAPSVT